MKTSDKVNQILEKAYKEDKEFRQVWDTFNKKRWEVLKGHLSQKELDEIGGGAGTNKFY